MVLNPEGKKTKKKRATSRNRVEMKKNWTTREDSVLSCCCCYAHCSCCLWYGTRGSCLFLAVKGRLRGVFGVGRRERGVEESDNEGEWHKKGHLLPHDDEPVEGME